MPETAAEQKESRSPEVPADIVILFILMSYGWATVFTLAAWFAGLVIDANVRVGDLGLRTVLPVIVMGCCVMKYIKDNSK